MVAPVAVNQQQLPQKAKLGDGVVRVAHGLHALLPGHADADVGPLYHGHVVGAVANGQGDRLGALDDKLDDLGLLDGGDSAADDGAARDAQVEEVAANVVAQGVLESAAVDDHGAVVLAAEVVAKLVDVPQQRLSRRLGESSIK